MRNLAEVLIPYTVPLVKAEYEDDINFLKMNAAVVDGYEVEIHCTKGFYQTQEYGTYYLTSIQINSKYAAFLPFNLVVKIAKTFLGTDYVGCVDFIKDGQKHYCWTLTQDEKGRPIPNPTKVKTWKESYEGWEYERLDPSGVNFY
ncbi:MAG: hypothetical protein ACREGR_00455 [Minisyncoccia bacterium]